MTPTETVRERNYLLALQYMEQAIAALYEAEEGGPCEGDAQNVLICLRAGIGYMKQRMDESRSRSN